MTWAAAITSRSERLVVEWQQGQLEHPHRLFGGAPQGWTVAVLDEGAKPFKVDARLDPPQIVVRGHQLGKDQLVDLRWFRIIGIFST